MKVLLPVLGVKILTVNRVYLYVIDTARLGEPSNFEDGIPREKTHLDLSIYKSDRLLKPGDYFGDCEYPDRVGSLRNLRMSSEDPNLTTPEELEGYWNSFPLSPNEAPKIIIITPHSDDTPVYSVDYVGTLNNYKGQVKGEVVSSIEERHIDMFQLPLEELSGRFDVFPRDAIHLSHGKPLNS